MRVIAKVRALEDVGISITKGKIYEVKREGTFLGEKMYAIVDDEEDGAYLYKPELFEVVEK